MANNAYITLLGTNNYLYGCIGLMYSWKKTNSKYPFYCIVTENITEHNISILEAIGYHVIRDEHYLPESYVHILRQYEETGIYDTPVGESKSDLNQNGWQHCWTKLRMFNYTQFDKLLYIDADTFITQNIDDLFEWPGWSSICEYDAPWKGHYRFHAAFFLIEPNKQVYEELLKLAEDNPLILHPATQEYQLSNDYDLLNLYKSDWGEHPELRFPSYTFIDSYILQTSDFFLPYLLNNFTKMRIIHLCGPKPWICGTQEVANYSGDWGLWKELYLIYIKFVNKALEDLYYNGIVSLPLIK